MWLNKSYNGTVIYQQRWSERVVVLLIYTHWMGINSSRRAWAFPSQGTSLFRVKPNRQLT